MSRRSSTRSRRATWRFASSSKRVRSLLAGGGLAAGLLAVLFGVVTIVGASAPGSVDRKQQAAQLQAQWQVAHEHAPAAKHPGQMPVSCVAASTAVPQIVNLSGHTPLPGQDYDSYVTLTSVEGTPYTVFGETNRIAVEDLPADPCSLTSAPLPVRYYPDPLQPGQLTLTAVQGDVVTFTTAAHTTGRFDYVTGQYL